MNGTAMDTPHVQVAIIGAGISGLVLAQALKKRGIQAQIFERDSARDARFEGYRLGVSEIGAAAIKDSLPEELWTKFNTMTEQRDGVGGLTIIDATDCSVIWDWGQFDWEPKPRVIPRSTLRELLVTDLAIRYGKAFTSYEKRPGGGATVYFADGTSVSCGLLVGADGASSRVKAAMGLDNKIDTDVGCVLIFTRGSAELVRPMPENFVTRYWMALMDNFALFESPWLPQSSTAGGALDNVKWEESNIALGLIGHRDDFAKFAPSVDKLSPAALKQCLLDIVHTCGVDQRLCDLARAGMEPTVQLVKFRSCTRPPEKWLAAQDGSSPAVLIGDALHSMPPTRGMGGNLALADAADLAACIAAGDLAGFQARISDRAFQMVGSSLFWARQYIHGGDIFSKCADVGSREEMERDARFGFPDNSSVDAVRAMGVAPNAA